MKPVGIAYAEIDLDSTKMEQGLKRTHDALISGSIRVEDSYKSLGIKSDQVYNMMRANAVAAVDFIKNKTLSSKEEIVRAEAAAAAKIKSINEQQFGAQTSLLDSLKKNWMAVTGVALAAFYTFQKFYQLAELGAVVKSIGESFILLTKNAGIAGGTLIAQLKEVTKGTVDESDLMKKANRLIIEGFSANQIVQIGEAARVASRIMGTDVATAYDQVADAIVNLRQRGLKTAGFVIDLNEAYQAHANRLGIAKDSLNDYGKQMALVEAVHKKYNEIVEKMGPLQDTEYEKIQRQKTAWKELREEIGKTTLSLIDYFFTAGRSKTLPELFGIESPRTKLLKTPLGYPTTEQEHGGIARTEDISKQNAKDQQQMMDDVEITKDFLQLRKQMLGVGYQTVESKVKELEIDRLLAIKALEKYGNTGLLITKTKEVYDAKVRELKASEMLVDNVRFYAAQFAEIVRVTENWHLDLELTKITGSLKNIESEENAILAAEWMWGKITDEQYEKKSRLLDITQKQRKVEETLGPSLYGGGASAYQKYGYEIPTGMYPETKDRMVELRLMGEVNSLQKTYFELQGQYSINLKDQVENEKGLRDIKLEELEIQKKQNPLYEEFYQKQIDLTKKLYDRQIELNQARANMDVLSLSAIGMNKYFTETKKELADTFQNFLPNVMKSFWDEFENSLKTGEMNWKSFANSLKSIWANLMRKMLESLFNDFLNGAIGGISNLLGISSGTTSQGTGSTPGWSNYIGLFGGLLGGLGTNIGNYLFSGGGMSPGGGTGPYAYQTTYRTGGMLHTGKGPGEYPSTYRMIPKFHEGIGPDEVLSIIRKDESVLTPAQMKTLSQSRPNQSISVTVQNDIALPPGTNIKVLSRELKVEMEKTALEVIKRHI